MALDKQIFLLHQMQRKAHKTVHWWPMWFCFKQQTVANRHCNSS